MLVQDYLERSAALLPEKVALVDRERRFTFRQMDEKSNLLAHRLIQAGVRKGDRVAVFLDNSAEAVFSIFGILKAGGVVVMVNSSAKVEKLSYLLNHSQARALVADGERLSGMEMDWAAIARLEAIFIAGDKNIQAGAKRIFPFEAPSVARGGETRGSGKPPDPPGIDADLAALIYTSGSTGKSKGVMVTHLNMRTVIESVAQYLKCLESDVILSVLPLSSSYGFYQAIQCVKMGSTLVIEPSFMYPQAVLEKMAAEKVTGFAMVPTIASMLVNWNLEPFDFSQLRYLTNAGAALPVELANRVRKLFPKVELYLMYGQTECGRAAYLPPDQADIRPASVGKGMPNQDHWLIDEQGRRLGPGETGELVIRGSHVMRGYWQDPEATDAKLKPGPLPGEKVLHTGDLFRTDAEGYLYFVSRKDDIIKTRGEKVSPKEVEEALYALDEVAEAAVVGVEDPVLGQAVQAILALKPGKELSAKQVLGHCRRHLEDFMVPKFVEFRGALPKNMNGKIDKLKLKGGTQ